MSLRAKAAPISSTAAVSRGRPERRDVEQFDPDGLRMAPGYDLLARWRHHSSGVLPWVIPLDRGTILSNGFVPPVSRPDAVHPVGPAGIRADLDFCPVPLNRH